VTPEAGAGDFEVVLDHVSKRFGTTVAVDDVSLSIRQGEFFSLLGPSGCGKSTTLRMVSGFERPTEGSIRIRGRVVNDVPPHRRDSNLVFQQLALFPHLDVFDNISFGLRIKRASRSEVRRKVSAMLELVGLTGFERRRIAQLSGGQQQRVAIARALINEPAVLLLDEPLGSLDLKLRMQMQRELKAIQHRVGTTFVYVTHDQGEALTMSDRMAVMNQGRVEQVGSGRDVYLRPRTTFVASFIGETNLLSAEAEHQEGEIVTVRVGEHRMRVRSRQPIRGGQAVTISARPERLRLSAADRNEQANGAWRSRLADASFLGNTIRYEVELPSGERLKVDRLAGAEPMLQQGQEVLLHWDHDAAVLVGGSIDDAVAAEEAE
jgi:spermidine/putrescine transport system ATP-binding protein